MSKLVSLFESVIDSTPFKIFFAVWTGIYLVQIIKGESTAPGTSLIGWILLAMAFGVFLV